VARKWVMVHVRALIIEPFCQRMVEDRGLRNCVDAYQLKAAEGFT
jgi:hypothetical protein